jgi:hypothetical protein
MCLPFHRFLLQDQIHNSIVSTLLALMDGLDPRGQVSEGATLGVLMRLFYKTKADATVLQKMDGTSCGTSPYTALTDQLCSPY